MTQIIALQTKPSPVLGAAIGLAAGLIASFAMDRFQAGVSALSPPGDDSSGEPATDQAADKISRALTNQPLPEEAKPSAGQFVHYALGGALGALYGLAAEYRPEVTTGYGSYFGVGVAAVLDEVVVPTAGLGSPPWRSPTSAHAYSLASHFVFGSVTEFVRSQLRTRL